MDLRNLKTLNVIELWPDLFEGLSPKRAQGINDGCVANWHEGWIPNREDVADLVAEARGEIDMAELLRRADARAMQEHPES